MLLCPIIPDKKLAFVAIPKNAGTSIRCAFGVAQGFVEQGQIVRKVHKKPWPSVHTKKDIQALKQEGYLRFCVARNPWVRLVSCWQEKIGKLTARQPNKFQLNMNFSHFARAVHAIPDKKSNRHFRSQLSYVYDGDVLLVDHFLRFETLRADWEMLQERFDLPALRHHRHTGADDSYRALYEKSPEARALVAKRYARDIEYFGYVF